jgi:hypothetical protein
MSGNSACDTTVLRPLFFLMQVLLGSPNCTICELSVSRSIAVKGTRFRNGLNMTNESLGVSDANSTRSSFCHLVAFFGQVQSFNPRRPDRFAPFSSQTVTSSLLPPSYRRLDKSSSLHWVATRIECRLTLHDPCLMYTQMVDSLAPTGCHAGEATHDSCTGLLHQRRIV